MIHYKSLGEGDPLIILHGLFGTADNWRTVARQLAEDYQVITVDLRNHGRSFWSDVFRLEDAAQDVIGLMDHLEIEQAAVLGHSMGGKVAMTMARIFPERVQKLILVDIAARQYPRGHDLIFKAVFAVNPEEVESRKEVEAVLGQYISEWSVVQFLMKSLARRPEGGFRWKTNFQVMYDSYGAVVDDLSVEGISAEVLVIRGTRSTYVTDQDILYLQEELGHVQSLDIDAGHWVHAERPEELIDGVKEFLQ